MRRALRRATRPRVLLRGLRRTGMTLVEVIVAMLLLVGVILVLGGFSAKFAQASSQAHLVVLANELAATRLDAVRQQPNYAAVDTLARTDTVRADFSNYTVKTQLVLDTVAEVEELDVTDAELSDQVVRRAGRANMAPQEYANQVVQSGQIAGLVAEVRRGKALATVMEAATITDESGNVIDLAQLRDDMEGPGAEVEMDDEGRPYHVHGDGSVHYLDEE